MATASYLFQTQSNTDHMTQIHGGDFIKICLKLFVPQFDYVIRPKRKLLHYLVKNKIIVSFAFSGGLRTGSPISEHDFSFNFKHHIS